MNKRIYFFLLLLVFGGAFGCLPPQTHTRLPDQTAKPPVPLLSGERLDERMDSLRILLEKGPLEETERRKAAGLLSAYRGLKEAPLGHSSDELSLRALRELLSRLSLLEEEFFFRATKDPSWETAPGSDREAMIRAYEARDFKGVVDRFRRMEQGPGAVLDPEIALVAGRALAAEGRMEEAIQTAERMAAHLEGKPDLFSLKCQIAAWYAHVGRTQDADLLYEQLKEGETTRAETIRNLRLGLSQFSERDGAVEDPDPLPLPHGGENGDRMEIPPVDPANAFLQEFDQLLHLRKFTEARDLLFSKEDEVQTESEREALARAFSSLDSAEEEFLQRRVWALSGREDHLEQIRQWVDEEKFEEAISSLEALERDLLASDESRAIKDRAVEKLIHRERNKAAKLFMAARQSNERTKKEEFLNTSYGILRVLVETYPSSPLSERVKENMARVQEELEKLRAAPR
jgi:hypothetical protein